MGGSSSKSSSTSNQKYNTNIVNISDTQLFNKSVNNFTADTVVKKASECSANMSQLQSIDLSNMQIEGDLNIGEVDQSQDSALTFECVQVDSFKNDIANGVLTSYMDALKNNFSSDIVDKLEATASTNSKGSFGATGGTSSNSKANIDYNFNNISETRTNIQNVVENAIQNNLSVESVKNCVAQVKQNQKILLAGTQVSGNVNIGVLRQSQATTLMANCVQKTDDVNKITTVVAQELGVTIDNTNSVTKTTEIKTSSTAESVNEGVGDAAKDVLTGAGNFVESVYEGATGLLTGTLGAFGDILPSLIIFLCIILVLAIGGYMIYSEYGGKSLGSSGSDSNNFFKNARKEFKKLK